jgi:hypothetical protein
MELGDSRKGGLNELLPAILHNENRYIPNHELKQLLHRIENDATDIYHTKYGSDDTKIKFNIDSIGDPGILLVGRQSAKLLECIRKLIKKNLGIMRESVRTEFEGYLKLCGEAINST